MAVIYMLCGKAGSGKSTYARQLREEHNAMILNCDEMMLALFGEYLGDGHGRVFEKCSNFLYRQAEELIALGVNVVLDFGFWGRQPRRALRSTFAQKGIATILCYIKTDESEVTRRLAKRNDDIQNGTATAYTIDDGMRAILDARFEEPEPDEIDILLESTH